MFIFETLKQKQEDRVEIHEGDKAGLVVSVFVDEPEVEQIHLHFTNVVFFSKSMFPGPKAVDCDMSRYQMELGHVSCLENSDLAAWYTRYYCK